MSLGPCAIHCLHAGVAGNPSASGQCCWCNNIFADASQGTGADSQAFQFLKHSTQAAQPGPFWPTISAAGGTQ